ncbi:MAG: S-layer homology domain-containing protein [Synechococcales cyanobacterium T60_A2020_003]|nr:S-layer homology domain-containing protein [Synechococcales cyanobacterium T60_A2020_003]
MTADSSVLESESLIFSDIGGYWAGDSIDALAQSGVAKGYPDGTFQPDRPLSRAELAAFLNRSFPDLDLIREAIAFPDVPPDHWAAADIRRVYQVGLMPAYTDRTFHPEASITRAEVLALLVSGLRLSISNGATVILPLYFDDAADVPSSLAGAIAAAIQDSLIVNYPDRRSLRPNQAIARGEMAAILSQVLQLPDGVPMEYVVWGIGLEDIHDPLVIPFSALPYLPELVKEMQIRLNGLSLYPGGRWIDGMYGPRTQKAIADFAQLMNLPNAQTQLIDEPFAQALLMTDPSDLLLEQARDRQKVFNDYLQQEAGYDATKLAFLDRGIQNSPYQFDISKYPDRLKEKPDNIEVTSYGASTILADGVTTVQFDPYPLLRTIPTIDANALSFLHSDIQQACLCMGSMVNDQVHTHWMGRDALKNVELWSSTKVIPLLNVISKANSYFPTSDVDNCVVRPLRRSGGYSFYDVAVDIVSYRSQIATSNSLAYTMKKFSSPLELETWLKDVTGNNSLIFRGRYGEEAFLALPELWDRTLQRRILTSKPNRHVESNTISTYDLVRVMSMLAWHLHIPQGARFPGAQWASLESLVRACGTDTARYLDVAIARLGLSNSMRSPVIMSKLGFGRSTIRDRTELVYLAHCQFIDQRPRAAGNLSMWRSFTLAFIAAKDCNDANQEARELDARMAAEVTETLRRIVTQELA